jgi:hypothetical protein
LGGREAIAQIRAALVKNVDEPGRTPYITTSAFLPNAGGCFSGSCANYVDGTTFAIFDLPPVPAGKRWIVTQIAGGFVNGNGRHTLIEVRNGRSGIVFDNLKWIFSGPFGVGSNFSSSVFSEQLFATFEPNEVPTLRVSTNSANLTGYSVITLEGYLIDATN